MKRALLMGFLVAAALVGSVWAAYTRDASGDGNVMITAAIEYLISDGVTVNAGTNLNTSALATNASVDGLEAGLGTATTIAVDGDAAGSAVAHLRGINKKLAAGIVGSGTAGTAAGGVLTIQGVASMTPVITVGSGTAGTPAGGILTIQGATSMTPILATVTGAVTTSGTVTEASASAMAADLNELTAAPVAKTLTPLVKEVAVSGTGVPLVATETFARKVYLMAKKTAGANTGLVYIGSSTVDVAGPQQMTLAPGDEITIDPGPGCKVDLATIYIDCAAANTDGVTGWYFPL